MKTIYTSALFLVAAGLVFFGFKMTGNTSEISQGEAPAADCITIDFDEDGNGEPMVAGTIISHQFAGYGVKIMAHNNASNHPSEALLFNSSEPTGNDYDLGSPHTDFGGPGRGEGGVRGSKGANDKALGNVLIIAENVDDKDGDMMVDDPDDEAKGGSLVFEFDQVVSVQSITLLDADDGNNGSVVAYSGPSGEEVSVPIPALGDNSLTTLNINASQVKILKVNLKGSGAVAELTFCPVK